MQFIRRLWARLTGARTPTRPAFVTPDQVESDDPAAARLIAACYNTGRPVCGVGRAAALSICVTCLRSTGDPKELRCPACRAGVKP